MSQDTQVVSAKASGAASTSVNSLGKPAALARLEPFLILAKSARGAAAAKLIAEATAAPGCYVFSELADTDAVRQIAADPAYAQTVALLQLFQFGTLSRYLENVSSYPTLTAAHLSKLRQLTLATLASQSRILSYQELSKALRLDVHLDAEGHIQSGIASSSSSDDGRAILSPSAIRALEDVVIDAIYAGLLSGRLDQQKARFHVDWVIGRDVAGDEEIVTMEKQLAEWSDTTTALLTELSQRIEAAKQDAQAQAQARRQHDEALASALAATQSSSGQHDGMDLDGQGDGTTAAKKKKRARA